MDFMGSASHTCCHGDRPTFDPTPDLPRSKPVHTKVVYLHKFTYNGRLGVQIPFGFVVIFLYILHCFRLYCVP